MSDTSKKTTIKRPELGDPVFEPDRQKARERVIARAKERRAQKAAQSATKQ